MLYFSTLQIYLTEDNHSTSERTNASHRIQKVFVANPRKWLSAGCPMQALVTQNMVKSVNSRVLPFDRAFSSFLHAAEKVETL